MTPTLQTLYDKIENQRKDILGILNHLTSEQLRQRPMPGKWSLAEIVSHIITAERMSVQYILKKVQGIQAAANSGLWAEVKINLLKVSQRLPGLKFRAPRHVVENTVTYKDLDQITREWERVRQDLQSLLEKIPDPLVNRMIYRHPFAGYLNIKQALIFFHEHIVHHTPQIKRLVKPK